MTEQKIQNEIILAINQRGHRLFRANAGKVITRDNRIIKLLPKGFPDTFGYRKSDGKFIAIEVKTEKGKLRPEQIKFKEFIETQNVLYGVARSVEAHNYGVSNLYELAEYVQLSEEYIAEILKHYKNKYGIGTHYGEYLITFDPLRVFKYKEI